MKVKVASRLGEVKEYYFSTKLKEIKAMNDRGDDVLNLGIGSPDMAPHQSIIDKLFSSANNPANHGYQSYTGLPTLRVAISEWYKRYYHTTLDPLSEILPLMGSKEGIMHISMTYLEEGDQVLVPDPGYPAYAASAKLAGATIRHYDLNERNSWLPDLEALESTDLSSVKIMWVNYPNMPTGKPASLELFKQLVAFAKRNEILIINDNPYSFVLNDHPLSLMQVPGAMEVAIELNSLSKAHNMAGWRLGMLVGSSERISEIIRFKSNMDSGMFKGFQEAAIQALSLGDDWFESLNAEYRQRREKAYELLDLLDCTYDKSHQGLFVWAKIPKGYKDGYAVSDECLYHAKVFVTPGGIFGSNGLDYVRVSLCTDVEKFDEAIKRVRQAIVHHQSHIL